jgi:uncharacterized membrane protein
VPGLSPSLRGVLGWIVGIIAFLALTLIAIGDGSPERIQARARTLDERTWIFSVLIVAAGLASLVALAFVVGARSGPPAPRIALACFAVVLSWLLVHTMFAMHYAHAYYGDLDPGPDYKMRGGLAFPGHHPPDYWDFLYYSAVIGMTCQVSDVQVTSHAMRRITLAHGVLAFFFNTGVLALAVNIIAAAI